MMKLLNIKWNGQKRVALVDMKFDGVEAYYLVGELPFYGDDSCIKLEFSLIGTIKFEYKEQADEAFKNYTTAKEMK